MTEADSGRLAALEAQVQTLLDAAAAAAAAGGGGNGAAGAVVEVDGAVLEAVASEMAQLQLGAEVLAVETEYLRDRLGLPPGPGGPGPGPVGAAGNDDSD